MCVQVQTEKRATLSETCQTLVVVDCVVVQWHYRTNISQGSAEDGAQQMLVVATHKRSQLR